MIQHVVMWKMKGATAEERRVQAEEVRAALLALRGQVPGLLELRVGIGAAEGAEAADVVLLSTHESWEALEAYQAHPAHVAAGAVIGPLRAERRVLDFEG